MPYGDDEDIVNKFYELKNKYKYPDEITLEFQKMEIEWYVSRSMKFRISNDFNMRDIISIR